MLVKRIEGATKDWGAPNDMDKSECGTLPARLVMLNGIWFWESAWEPTPEELKALNEGGSIRLFVSSIKHPVVALGVGVLEEESLEVKGG